MKTASASLFALLLPFWLTVSCGDAEDSSEELRADYLRSDDSAVTTSWQTTMNSYQVIYQSEDEVVESLELDPSNRTVTDKELNRVSYSTGTGIVEMFYDEGRDEPYHAVSYLRDTEFHEQTWKNSSDLKKKWEAGALLGAKYISQLTKLTPVVWVGEGTDEAYATALSDGYAFLLTIDGWPLWVDQLGVTIDNEGVFEFHTAELPYDVKVDGTIDCRTQAEVKALLPKGYGPLSIGFSPPIFYGFRTDTATLTPAYLAIGTDDSGGYAIALDRAKTEW
jgi:hypothetical protein